MHSTTLRKVGGSVMLAVPPTILDLLGLREGEVVDVRIEDDQLVIVPRRRPRYSLEDLLAQCAAGPLTEEDRSWIDSPPAGSELL